MIKFRFLLRLEEILVGSRQYRASKISCGRCGIDHPYFACNPENSEIMPNQPTNTTDNLLLELIKENQSLGQELREIKSMLASVVEELRKSVKTKVLQD